MSSITKVPFLFTLILLISDVLHAQKEDYFWVMGDDGGYRSPAIDSFWTSFKLNFNEDPMRFEWMPARPMKFDATCASLCHPTGELFCYSNGMSIDGVDGKVLLGADTINYGAFWELWRVEHANIIRNFGFTLPQGMLFLPWPGKSDSIFYATIYLGENYENVEIGKYGIISKSKEDRNGVLVAKDIQFHNEKIKNSIQAVRHSNGRDWWIILIGEDNVHYYSYLLNKDGIKLINSQQIGLFNKGIGIGNMYFSLDGTKFVSIDALIWTKYTIISIFDFDRCTGTFSNGIFDTIPTYEAGLGIGAIFSPDGKYLYANNDYELYQYDMDATEIKKSRILLDTFDGFQSHPHEYLYFTTFGYWAYGPDGRLYNVSGYGSARHMHIMDYPNEAGQACSFRQHALKIPNNHWTIPNFPHYRLGPLDGSPCDTLGLDNHPVAKYRYEPDSIDYLRLRFTDLSYFRPETWVWDFGDGSPRVTTQHPYHTFSGNGTYHVCLTVSNENSSNTVCRDITLGTVNSDDTQITRADITLFPNPVEDYLLVTLGEYVPGHGQIMIYDITGRAVLTQRMYYGQNSIDMRGLQAGMYVWKVVDFVNPSPALPSRRKGEDVVVREGKVVKR
ncbi:MAG: PKD domain-containing protein [Saprospiraceae bacterium]